MSKSAERLSAIITVDQVKLRRWYDVAEIITHAKDDFYDYRLGRLEVVASVDLLINQAIKQINEIKELIENTKELTKDEMYNVSTHLKFFDRVNYVAWVDKLLGIKLSL